MMKMQSQILRQSSRMEKPWAGLIQVLPSPKPQTKKDIQILRKLWHMGMILGVAFLYGSVFPTKQSALTILALTGGTFSFLDISRLWNKSLNRFIVSLFGPLMRKRELISVSAVTPFLFATAIVIAFFPKAIAIYSLFCLALGDVAAGIVGIKFGKDEIIKGKSLQGSLACFFTCTLITFAFIVITGISTQYMALICLLGGLVPTVTEIFSTQLYDDNFAIPTMTAGIMYPVLLLFGN